MKEIDDKFQMWLISKKGLETKSARDVVSRLKRVDNICEINFNRATEKIIFELNENIDFNNLTLTVKSQLRRAVRLYKEFQQ